MNLVTIYDKIKIPLVVILGLLLIGLFFYPKDYMIQCDTGDRIIIKDYNPDFEKLCVEVPGGIFLLPGSNFSAGVTASNPFLTD